MAKHNFSYVERFSLWSVYGGECFWCRKPIAINETEGEHLLPESLADDPERLKSVLAAFGKPVDFNLNDYPNWVPSCRVCNGLKGEKTYETSPIFVVHLEVAARRADACRAVAEKLKDQKAKDRALGKIAAMIEQGAVTPDDVDELGDELLDGIMPAIVAASFKAVEIHLPGKWFIIQRHSEQLAWVVGKVDRRLVSGVTPTGPNPDPQLFCTSCEHYGPWKGINCQRCGKSQVPDHGE